MLRVLVLPSKLKQYLYNDKISAMFDKRLRQIKKNLKKEKLDAVLISSVENITYLSGYANFSKEEREAYILVGKNFEYIITDGRYSEAVLKNVPHLTLFERGNKKSTEDLFKKHRNEIKVLGIEEDDLTVSEHKTFKKYFINIKHFNLRHLRNIKSREEIKKIENAAKLGDKAFEYILRKIKVGISEKELAWELEKYIKDKGGEFSFPAIVAFGKNSSVPHHQTGQTKLGPKNGQFILIDMGVKYQNYCSDMTRVVFFGKPSDKQKKIYNIVLTVQQKAVDFINKSIKSGKKIMTKDVDKVAREYIKSQNFPDIPHSLGHGVGLEVHEHPYLSFRSKEELKEGMVFSIEPGIYLPAGRQGLPDFGSPRFAPAASLRAGEAGGVRIEDLYLLEKDGLKQITNSPKELIII